MIVNVANDESALEYPPRPFPLMAVGDPPSALMPPTQLRCVETALCMWAWELPWLKSLTSHIGTSHRGIAFKSQQ